MGKSNDLRLEETKRINYLILKISKAIGVNFFFEDKESKTDLNQAMEKAMEALGRRVDKLSKN